MNNFNFRQVRRDKRKKEGSKSLSKKRKKKEGGALQIIKKYRSKTIDSIFRTPLKKGRMYEKIQYNLFR